MNIQIRKLNSSSGKIPIGTVVIFILLVSGIVFINSWIDNQVVDMKDDYPAIPVMKKVQTQAPRLEEGVIRKTRVIPGNNIVESIFYSDGKELARQSHNEKGLVSEEGILPEGEIRFKDYYTSTYGTEIYRNGKKEGESEVFYNDGHLKAKINYRDDDIRTKSEYYADGSIRFEVDYQFARNKENDKEVGVGKLYYPNGQLKYEWNMAINEAVGFKKSYNSDGSLRHEAYFDISGNSIKKT